MTVSSVSNIGIYTFPVSQQKVRTIEYEGEVLFVANDVAAVLGYSDPNQAVRDHCSHIKILRGKAVEAITTSPRGTNMIPESDVYRLIMRSNLPSAIQFQDWICEDVLPSIMDHGFYINPAAVAVRGEEAILADLRKEISLQMAEVDRELHGLRAQWQAEREQWRAEQECWRTEREYEFREKYPLLKDLFAESRQAKCPSGAKEVIDIKPIV